MCESDVNANVANSKHEFPTRAIMFMYVCMMNTHVMNWTHTYNVYNFNLYLINVYK